MALTKSLRVLVDEIWRILMMTVFALQAPKVSEVVLDSCQVDWQACKPMGTDSIIYCLQLQNVHSRDQEYKPVSSRVHVGLLSC